jgi:hypothetical protein
MAEVEISTPRGQLPAYVATPLNLYWWGGMIRCLPTIICELGAGQGRTL